MADFTKPTIADMVVNGADHNLGTDGSMQLIDWESEDAHWRQHHAQQSYAVADLPYDFYRQAYRYGYEASFTNGRMPWNDEIEAEMARGWPQARAESRAEWSQVRDAVREAYRRASSR